MMFKNIFILFCALLISSCGYRNIELTPLIKKELLGNKSQGQDGADIADEEENSEQSKEEASTDSTKLNNLLMIYLNNFIKEVVVSSDGSVELVDPNSLPENYNYDTRVDYQGMYKLFKNKDKNYLALTKAIRKEFKTLSLDLLTDKEKLAFYINAYNFFAMDVIVRNYKKANGQALKSIKEIKPTLTNKYAIFTTKFIRLSGVKGLTHLDNIEKKLAMNIGRKLLGGKTDARLHFAIICASIGCPIIPTTPYTGDQVNEQLDLVTAQGLKHSRMFKISGQKAIVSKIFDWYKSDFDNDPNGPRLQFLKYHTQNRSLFSSIGYVSYNWNLNAINGLNINYKLPEIKMPNSLYDPCSDIISNKDFKLIGTCSKIMQDNIGGNNSDLISSSELCLYKTSNMSDSTYYIEGSLTKKRPSDSDELPILLSGVNERTNNNYISFIDEEENQHGGLITYKVNISKKMSSLKIKMSKSWIFGFGTTHLFNTYFSCVSILGINHE